jgi:deazaflavin-dependent oxidoreductase (nitroreductase family)
LWTQQLNRTLRRFFWALVYLYGWNSGWLLGHRFPLLVHVGRHTGLRRHTVLEVMEYRQEGPEAVVMSAFGRNADWLRNIKATPSPEVVIGSQHFVAAHRFLDEEEAIRALTAVSSRSCRLSHSVRPIVRSELSAGGRPLRLRYLQAGATLRMRWLLVSPI